MVQLTQNQGRVGNVLQEGNQLIADTRDDPETDTTDIRKLMTKLNDRWEDLRVNAMQRQTRLII